MINEKMYWNIYLISPNLQQKQQKSFASIFFEGNKYLKTIVPDFRGALFTWEKEEPIILGKSGAFPLIIFFPFEMFYFYNLRTMMPIV